MGNNCAILALVLDCANDLSSSSDSLSDSLSESKTEYLDGTTLIVGLKPDLLLLFVAFWAKKQNFALFGENLGVIFKPRNKKKA